MKSKLSFIVLLLLIIMLTAFPSPAQDKYKIYLTNGRSISCTKYWYEGEQILLTTDSGITFGFDKQEIVKIEGAEGAAPQPAESPKTPLAPPPAAPPSAPKAPLAPPPLAVSAPPAPPASPLPPKPQVSPSPVPPPSPPVTAAPPPAGKPPAPAAEKSSPQEPEIIIDDIQEEKNEPEVEEP